MQHVSSNPMQLSSHVWWREKAQLLASQYWALGILSWWWESDRPMLSGDSRMLWANAGEEFKRYNTNGKRNMEEAGDGVQRMWYYKYLLCMAWWRRKEFILESQEAEGRSE